MPIPFFDTIETTVANGTPSRIVTNGSQTTREYISNGSPEGSISAPVGSRCTDTTTGIKWRKNTGSGNTGWSLQSGRITRVDTNTSAQSLTFDGYENEVRVYRREGNNSLTINAGTGKTFTGGATYIVVDVDNGGITLMLSSNVIEIISIIPSGTGIEDGNRGDISVYLDGVYWKINNNTISNDKLIDGTISNSKLASMAVQTLKGSLDGGVPLDLTPAQARLILRGKKYKLPFSSTQNWDLNNGLYQVTTATSNFTLNMPSNIIEGETAFIYIKQDATGSRILTLGSGYKTAGGLGVSLTTAANAVDRLMFFFDTDSTCTVTITKDIK